MKMRRPIQRHRFFSRTHVGVLAGALMALTACGEGLHDDAGLSGAEAAPTHDSAADGLHITPHVELLGLEDIYADFELTHLDFTARLFLLPADGSAAGVSAELDVAFENGHVYTTLNTEQLVLAQGGTYDVLLGIYPASSRASVVIGGKVDLPAQDVPGLDARGKAEEGDDFDEMPNLEPVPMPARNPADDPGEASSGNDEPVPMPARNPESSDPHSEPVPMPARNRGKGDLPEEHESSHNEVGIPGEYEVSGAGEPVFVQSRRIFEFRVGRIALTDDTRELWVTWDVSEWLSNLIADAFGEPTEDSTSNDPNDGFSDTTRSFSLSSRN
ncbi:MAG: hypothetical protein ACE366_27840 [Bradymonadia bacterium]